MMSGLCWRQIEVVKCAHKCFEKSLENVLEVSHSSFQNVIGNKKRRQKSNSATYWQAFIQSIRFSPFHMALTFQQQATQKYNRRKTFTSLQRKLWFISDTSTLALIKDRLAETWILVTGF